VRTFLATLVGAAVLATAVVSVRLHLHVAHLRYRLWALDQDRVRAEREQRLARADLEAAKAPRRLLERWTALREEAAEATPPPAPAPAVTPPSPSEPAAPEDDGTPTADDADARPAPPQRPAPRTDVPDEPQPIEEGDGR
jgi:outer membrane biosynthesis protein TonB